jgi:hypothetical protein
MNIITKKITFFCLQSPLSRVCVYLFLLSYCKEQFWSFIEVYNNVNVLWRNQVKLKVCFVSRCVGGGGGSRKFYPRTEQFKYYLNKSNGNVFLTQTSNFLSSPASKKFFPDLYDLKKDLGDEHKFCTTLMEKTVGRIVILNSDLFSDQFFFSECFEWLSVIFWECVSVDSVNNESAGV